MKNLFPSDPISGPVSARFATLDEAREYARRVSLPHERAMRVYLTAPMPHGRNYLVVDVEISLVSVDSLLALFAGGEECA